MDERRSHAVVQRATRHLRRCQGHSFFPAPCAFRIRQSIVAREHAGACYGGDKLARLYCYDIVTADACGEPNMFICCRTVRQLERAAGRCVSLAP
jgi:hypothetical protein